MDSTLRKEIADYITTGQIGTIIQNKIQRRIWELDQDVALILALSGSNEIDSKQYLNMYPDVAYSGIDAIEHYVKYGRNEGRILNLNNNCNVESKKLSTKIEEIAHNKSTKIICTTPFYNMQILTNGNIVGCCASYCRNYYFGNLLEKNLQQIWCGDKAKYFRNKLLNCDYSLCDLKLCRNTDKCSLEDIKKYYDDKDIIKLPEEIGIGYDTACNLNCNICPFHKKKNSEEDLTKLKKYEASFFPYLGNCKVMSLSGAGDPFGSKYSMGLIRRVSEAYPQIKFRFHTNAQLLSPNTYFKLGLSKRVLSISVSVHAATQEAYKKVTGSEKFDRLQRHLKFYSWLKSKGEIQKLHLNYVVCTENYRDMPAFVEMAIAMGASVSFTQYRNLRSEAFAKDYANHAPFLKEHREHNEFLDVLKNPILKDKCINYDGLLKELVDMAHRKS